MSKLTDKAQQYAEQIRQEIQRAKEQVAAHKAESERLQQYVTELEKDLSEWEEALKSAQPRSRKSNG